MLAVPSFGISSHLFKETRLDREHLVLMAAHGFEAVEVCATRPHFDYRDPAAVNSLAEWLSDTRLALYAMHAPLGEGRRGRRLDESVLECDVRRGPPRVRSG